jgi:hypothetical protein
MIESRLGRRTPTPDGWVATVGPLRTSIRTPLAALLAAVLFAAAGPAGAFTIDFIQIDHSASAALGGGIDGGDCEDGPCSGSGADVGPVSPAIPVVRNLLEAYSTTTGTNSVEARGHARLGIMLPSEGDLEFHGADTVLTGDILATTRLRDSQAASFHTSAEASVRVDDRIVFTVPEIGPGGGFSIRTRLIGFSDDLTTGYGGSLRISRVSDDLTLYATATPTSWQELDLTAYAGEAIALEFAAAMSMDGEAGFGGGADSLLARDFSSRLWFVFAIRHAVPEPGTAVLLAVALGLGGRCRSRWGWGRPRP